MTYAMITPQCYGAVGDGSNDDTAAVNKAIAAAGALGGELTPEAVTFPRGTYVLTDNVVVPANVFFCFRPGARLSISSGKFVDFYAPQAVESCIQQIFSGLGAIRFRNDACPPAVYPEWWGAVKGGLDCGPIFNAMFQALNGSHVVLTGAYFFSTPIVLSGRDITMRGLDQRGTGFYFTGDAPIAMNFSQTTSLKLADFCLNLVGKAGVGIQVQGQDITLDGIYVNGTGSSAGRTLNGFSEAAIRTDPTTRSSFKLTFRNVHVVSVAGGQEHAVGIDINCNCNSVVLEDCFFSGCLVGARIGAPDASNPAGSRVHGCHFEAFGAPTSPGGPNAVGLLLNSTWGMPVSGCGFQMNGDSAPAGAGQKAIRCIEVRGGSITDNHFDGAGQCSSAIDIADARTHGVRIDGNHFHDLNGYGISASGSGSIRNVIVGQSNTFTIGTGVVPPA